MPSIQENLRTWNESYQWRPDGEDWSLGWGSSEIQWYAFHLPRLHAFLPAKSILEIATGRGRWTQYLLRNCDKLIGVDLAPNCIAKCQQLFSNYPEAEFHVNDGQSLHFCPDDSIDLVFSFDSLVHVESDVITSYLKEIKRILRPNGIAYLHHSNLGEYRYIAELIKAIPDFRTILKQSDLINTGWRGISVSAAFVEQTARENGLACVGQELINWGNESPDVMLDCISVLTPQGSKWQRKNQVWKNSDYMKDVRYSRRVGATYGNHSFSGIYSRS